MVSLANVAVASLIAGVFFISLLNPGGAVVAVLLAALILGLYAFLPFVQDYVLSVNKGKAARKNPAPKQESGGGGR